MYLTTTYPLYYTSAERPGDDSPWTVYVEQYRDKDDAEPIDGSTERVSTHPTEAEADAEARRLQAAVTQPEPQPDTIAGVLAEFDAWREDRADLSANDGPGTDPDDWAASDDAGCDLASRMAELLRPLAPTPALEPAEQECPTCEGVGYFPDASDTGDDEECDRCNGNGTVAAA